MPTPPLPTPAGAVCRPVYLVQQALCASAAFRAWCGAADAAAAAAHCVFVADLGAEPTRPFVALEPTPGTGQRRKIATGTYIPRGGVRVSAFGLIPEQDNDDAARAARELANQWGGLLAAFAALDGAEVDGVRLALSEIAVTSGGDAGLVAAVAQADNRVKYERWEGQADLLYGGESA